jgi:hypothetical protein
MVVFSIMDLDMAALRGAGRETINWDFVVIFGIMVIFGIVVIFSVMDLDVAALKTGLNTVDLDILVIFGAMDLDMAALRGAGRRSSL